MRFTSGGVGRWRFDTSGLRANWHRVLLLILAFGTAGCSGGLQSRTVAADSWSCRPSGWPNEAALVGQKSVALVPALPAATTEIARVGEFVLSQATTNGSVDTLPIVTLTTPTGAYSIARDARMEFSHLSVLEGEPTLVLLDESRCGAVGCASELRILASSVGQAATPPVEFELRGESAVVVARCDGEVHLQVALASDRLPLAVSVGQGEDGLLTLQWASTLGTPLEVAYHQAVSAAASLARSLGYSKVLTRTDESLVRPYLAALARTDVRALTGYYADVLGSTYEARSISQNEWLTGLASIERAWPDRVGHGLVDHAVVLELGRTETPTDTVATKRIHTFIAFARQHPRSGALEAGLGHLTFAARFHYSADGEPQMTIVAECMSETLVPLPQEARPLPQQPHPGRQSRC